MHLTNVWQLLALGIVVTLALLVVGFWFIRSGKWVWVKEHLSPPTTLYIRGVLFCQDQHIRFPRCKVHGKVCQIDKQHSAWYLLHGLFVPGTRFSVSPKQRATEYLPISERDSVPIDFFHKLSDEEKKELADLEAVADEAGNEVLVTAATKAQENMLFTFASIIVLTGGLIFVIMALIRFFQNGRAF